MFRIVTLTIACCVLAACTSGAGVRTDAVPSDSVPIGSVQGRGDVSPRVGELVAIQGTVVGEFGQGLGGWFVQDRGDGDPATSDAIFVETANRDVRAGQQVRIRGRVVERDAGNGRSLTTLEPQSIQAAGVSTAGLEPTAIDAAPAAIGDWERYEGMYLRIAAPLALTGTHDLTRHGELSASFGGRLFAPTETATPGEAAAAVAADNARRSLLLDDASSARHPSLWAVPDPPPRTGSLAVDTVGILDQRHGAYRLQLTEPLRLHAAPRPPPPRVRGDVRIASLNLENLFNGDGRGGGFPTPRGAKTPQQLSVQLSKLVVTIRGLNPDIVALMELENDGYGTMSSLSQLVAALNADGGDWRQVDAGHGPGSDEIRVGLIYRSTRIVAAGRPATLEGEPFDTYSRVPLTQAFRAGRGPAFVVAANHFKSKGCSAATGQDADRHDGQACWNAVRTESARRLDRWLSGDPTGSGSALTLIVGDLNAYAQEDPVRHLRSRGWVDAFTAAGNDRLYSYVYDGRAGRLDHALLSPALAKRLKGAAEWHSNADEAANVGYRAANSPENAGLPWRSSDHDPLLIGLDLRR